MDPFPAREDLQVYIKLFPGDVKFILGFALFICMNVFMGVHLRCLIQEGFRGLVVNDGRGPSTTSHKKTRAKT